MFAVKGWSVDASTLKPQTEPFRSVKKATQDDGEKPTRKRKREEAAAAQQPDVGRLWEQHIEGKKPVKARTKKDKKRQRREQDDTREPKTTAPEQNSAEETAPAAPTRDNALNGKKQEKKSKAQHGGLKNTQSIANPTVVEPSKPGPKSATATPKLTPMQAAMRQKLISARFRHLNETLYTAPSDKALGLFDQNPEMFEDYHAGFRQQVSVWPENPVDTFIATIRSRGAIRAPKLPRHRKPKPNDLADVNGFAPVLPRTHGTCIIADLGCGDARLSQTLKESNDTSTFNLKVHSFDLHSPSALVTKADISKLPLADNSVDVAIFCLALMGTNWISFIEEAYRVLHWKGELWVAEIKSRFGRVGRGGGRTVVEHSVGGKRKQAAMIKAQEVKKKEAEEVDEQAVLRTEVDGVETQQQETDVSAFVDVLKRRGFVLKDGDRSVDLNNKMFVRMEFIKAAAPIKGKNVPEVEPGQKTKKRFIDDKKDDVATDDETKVLKPCLYKIR